MTEEYTGPWPPEDVELTADDEADVDPGAEEQGIRRR